MQTINISKIIIIILAFCAILILISFFIPSFFIKKAGQFCLIDYHCKNIDCREELKKFKDTTPLCLDKINECTCNPNLGGGVLFK